jgi:hypothetical protein
MELFIVSRLPPSARIAIVIIALGALIALLIATGVADERAKPGSGGRVPVPPTATP